MGFSSAPFGMQVPSNLSQVWDWSYFWSVFENFLGSYSGFVLIAVAAMTVGLVLSLVMYAGRQRK